MNSDPRIVRFGTLEYRYCDGRLEWRVPGKEWHQDAYTPADYAAVAELRHHPTQRQVSAA